MLLTLKLIITPLLVAGVSLAARRFGPTVGGLMLGLPWMTGPVLFFLALERGDAFLIETARGALLAVPPIAAFAILYGRLASVLRWYWCLPTAAISFAASGLAMSTLDISHRVAAVLGAISLLTGYALVPRPTKLTGARSLPWWDIPVRMLATALLVAGIAATNDYLGPTLSGIVSSYPVILTVIATFTHHRWGVDAVRAMLRGVLLSLLSFVGFFWTVSIVVPHHGLVASYVAATLAGLMISGSLIFGIRHYSKWITPPTVQ